MTWNNPDPLANPLNHHYASSRGRIITDQKNAQNLQVPCQNVPLGVAYRAHDRSRSLQVPCQDVPMNSKLDMAEFMCQFDNDLYRLPDGTIMNVRTGKQIRGHRASGDWNDGYEWQTKQGKRDSVWNDNHGYSDTIDSFSQQISLSDGKVHCHVVNNVIGQQETFSKEEQARNEFLKKKDAELKANLTDEQKDLLADLDSGKFI